MTSNSKRLIASFAALQILLYHCWMPVFPFGTFPGSAERFLIAATYPGVDTFFFLSAFSMVSRPVEDYRRFITNRTMKLLPMFFIAWIAGQFMWFIPSIMIVYLVFPPLYKVCSKKPALSFFLLITGWVGLVYLCLDVLDLSQNYGIFLFRIPSVILGAYAVKFKEKLTGKKALLTGIILLAAGTALIYEYGYINKLSVPFRDTFYLTGLPVMLGTILILDLIASRHRFEICEYFGKITFELYFSQMLLGTSLISQFYRLTGIRIVTNIATIAVIIAISVAINTINQKFSH